MCTSASTADQTEAVLFLQDVLVSVETREIKRSETVSPVGDWWRGSVLSAALKPDHGADQKSECVLLLMCLWCCMCPLVEFFILRPEETEHFHVNVKPWSIVYLESVNFVNRCKNKTCCYKKWRVEAACSVLIRFQIKTCSCRPTWFEIHFFTFQILFHCKTESSVYTAQLPVTKS